MNQNGPCLLCNKSTKRIKKSHIIPDFMYQGLFDDSHRMILFNIKDDPTNKKKVVQTGFFEKYILCDNCDNVLIGRLERYASVVLYGGHYKGIKPFKVEPLQKDGVKFLNITGLDYPQLKKFILSLLWRAHVSKNPFFKKVDIGEHADKIKKILNGDPVGSDELYRVSIYGLAGPDQKMINLMPDPEVHKNKDGWFASFLINGFLYFINLQPGTNQSIFNHFYLTENGGMKIPITEGELGNSLLYAIGLPPYMADHFIPTTAFSPQSARL